MIKNLTTLAEVSNRVDALNQNCHDKLIDIAGTSISLS